MHPAAPTAGCCYTRKAWVRAPSYDMASNKTERQFLELYERYADAVYRHCYFRVSDKEAAEDIAHETFARMWEYAAEGNQADNPKALLYRIAGNLVIDHYRRKKAVSLEVLQEEGFDPRGSDEESVTGEAEGSEALALLAHLPEKDRAVVAMRYIDGLSVSEIAKLTDETPNVISVRIHRAVKKLRDIFEHGPTT